MHKHKPLIKKIQFHRLVMKMSKQIEIYQLMLKHLKKKKQFKYMPSFKFTFTVKSLKLAIPQPSLKFSKNPLDLLTNIHE